MAANALVIEEDIPIGATEHLYLLKFTPSTSYPTNGEALSVAKCTAFKRVFISGGGYVGEFVTATQKLKLYRQKDPAAAGGADIALPEVANAVDLSAVVMYGWGIGA